MFLRMFNKKSEKMVYVFYVFHFFSCIFYFFQLDHRWFVDLFFLSFSAQKHTYTHIKSFFLYKVCIHNMEPIQCSFLEGGLESPPLVYKWCINGPVTHIKRNRRVHRHKLKHNISLANYPNTWITLGSYSTESKANTLKY